MSRAAETRFPSSVMISNNAVSQYPSHVEPVSFGKALVASQDLEAETIVEKFEGPDVEYDKCSDYDKIYVLNYQPPGTVEWRWLLPTSNARYANHSCDPNMYINKNLELVTKRPVKAGEHLTFVYNNGEPTDEWDPIWNFKCCCGAANCQGEINAYRPFLQPQA
ncbi:hypothetical protein BJ742DRAFT_790414 [Cladochytrium replicatum]|nr:hypothetical protein BJ742DRAFT_790414 [Cladochytrium replicatum]